MEMKNCCSSPRDRIDDELLARLLNEKEELFGNYGECAPRRNNNSRCRRCQINVNPTVSCQPVREKSYAEDIDNGCGCEKDEDCAKKNCLSGYPLAMSYTPDQEWRNLFEIEEALHHGTIFRELELPFYPACGNCR